MDEFSKRVEALSPDKRELLEIFLQEKRQQTSWLQDSYLAPRDEVEASLAAIWGQVLGVERVGVSDNFFELGGDSILSIQIIAKAAEIGIAIDRNQLFEQPTIAELAPLARAHAVRQQAAEDDAGPVPPAPAQRALAGGLAGAGAATGRSAVLELAAPEAEHLAAAARCLVEHHAALRLRGALDGGVWQQRLVAAPAPAIECEDVSLLEPAGQAAAVWRAARELRTGWDLDGGPPLRLRLLARGAGRPAAVVLGAAALLCDEESLRILVEDLGTACTQLRRGEPVALPRCATSFPRWCRELASRAASAELAGELDWWDEQAAAASPLPLGRAPAAGTALPSGEPLAVVLGPDQSRRMLHDIPARHRAQVAELVLAALARAVAAGCGSEHVRLDLAGSARAGTVFGMDLSRTVGACDFVFPVRISLAGAATALDALKAVKQQLRAVPARGLGYALLAGGVGAERLGRRPRAQILVSYHSQLAATAGAEATPRIAGEAFAPPPAAAGNYPLRLLAGVAGGQVRLAFTADESCDRLAVERLARRFEQELLQLIDACQDGAAALTPSDFPDAGLDAADLTVLFTSP